MTIGADGSGMHSLHASKAGRCTVRLLKTSPLNAGLRQMYDFQTNNSSLHGRNVITFQDAQRGDDITATEAAFQKGAGITYAKDGGMNEWTFNIVTLEMVLGTGIPDVNI